jgi:hypothetical protein
MLSPQEGQILIGYSCLLNDGAKARIGVIEDPEGRKRYTLPLLAHITPSDCGLLF